MEVKETDEQALERYLQGSGPLSRATRNWERSGPRQRSIKRCWPARSAVGEQIPRRARPWRWTAMAALAATVLLSFGLVMRLALEPQEPVGTTQKKRADAPQLKDSAPSHENATHLAAPVESEEVTPATPSANAPASDTSAVTALEAASAPKEARIPTSSEHDDRLMRSLPRSKAVGARHEGTAAERLTAPPTALDDTSPTPPAKPAAAPAPEAYAVAAPAMSPAPGKMLQKTVKWPRSGSTRLRACALVAMKRLRSVNMRSSSRPIQTTCRAATPRQSADPSSGPHT